MRYEDLIQKPEESLTRLCEFIGVSFDSAMFDYAKTSTYDLPDPQAMSQWSRKLSERDVGRSGANSPPYMVVPDAEQEAKLDELAKELEELETSLTADHEEWDAEQERWAAENRERLGEPIAWTPIEPVGFLALGGTQLERLEDGSFLAVGSTPGEDIYHIVTRPGKTRITAIRLEVLPHESFPKKASGRSEKGTFKSNL